jgi:hypothetical protein
LRVSRNIFEYSGFSIATLASPSAIVQRLVANLFLVDVVVKLLWNDDAHADGQRLVERRRKLDSTITLDEHAARSTPAAIADQTRSERIRDGIGMSRILRPPRTLA